MDSLLKHLQNIADVDSSTLTLISLICCAVAWFVKDSLANPAAVVFITPVIIGISVVAYYTAQTFELFASNKLDQWLMWGLLSATVGTSRGIGLLALLVRLWERPRTG